MKNYVNEIIENTIFLKTFNNIWNKFNKSINNKEEFYYNLFDKFSETSFFKNFEISKVNSSFIKITPKNNISSAHWRLKEILLNTDKYNNLDALSSILKIKLIKNIDNLDIICQLSGSYNFEFYEDYISFLSKENKNKYTFTFQENIENKELFFFIDRDIFEEDLDKDLNYINLYNEIIAFTNNHEPPNNQILKKILFSDYDLSAEELDLFKISKDIDLSKIILFKELFYKAKGFNLDKEFTNKKNITLKNS